MTASHANIKLMKQNTDKIGLKIMHQCLTVKPTESVLVVTDDLLEPGIPEMFVQETKKITKRVQLVRIKPTGQHGGEPTEEIAKIMAEFDVVILATYYSLSHTKARKKACEKGVRIASLPGITWDTIKRTLVIDYRPVANLSRKIADLLTSAKNARLTSPSGTDLIFSLQGRTAVADTGLITKHGDFGNLPGGEAFIAPVEGKTEGELVFDKAYGDRSLASISFTVINGVAEFDKVKPCRMARLNPQEFQEIKNELDRIGPKSRNIAELGIGTNKAASLKGGLLELEKIFGTCHVALGSNIHFGGTVDVPYHVDGLILKPTLTLDDKVILENGRFVFQ